MSQVQTNPDYLAIGEQQAQQGVTPVLGAQVLGQNTPGTPTPASSPAETLIGASGAGLSPSAAAGIANTSQSAYDAAIKSQFANLFTQAGKYADSLRSTPVQFQSDMWAKASPAMRGLLQAAGYQPPQAPVAQSSPGWWHGITRMLDVAGHTLKSAVGNGLSTLASPFTWAGSLIDQAQRDLTYSGKQAELSALNSGGNPNSLGTFLNALNPVNLVHDWSAVRYGGSTFDPFSLQYVQRQMGITGDTLRLAKAMASGQTLIQVLRSVPQSQRANAYALIASTPNFQSAVSLLKDSHLSFGESVFGGLNPAQTHAMYPGVSESSQRAFDLAGQGTAVLGTLALAGTGNEGEAGGVIAGAARTVGGLAKVTGAALQATATTEGALQGKTPDQAYQLHPFGMAVNPASGVADGLVSWYMNPLFVGMTARGAYRVGEAHAIMDAMGSVPNMQSIYANVPKFNRFATKVVETLTTPWTDTEGHVVQDAPNFQAMQAAGIPVGPMADVIKANFADLKAASETGDTHAMGIAFGRMIGGDHGLIQMMRGSWSRYYRDATQFPQVTVSRAALDGLRGVGRAAWGGRRVDVAGMTPLQIVNSLTSEMAGADAADIERQIEASAATPKFGVAARFLRRATNLTPQGVIDFSKPDAGVQMERALAYALPQNAIDKYMNVFYNLPMEAIGQKRTLYMAAVREMLAAAIDHENEQSRQWLADFLDRENYGAISGAAYVDPYDPEGDLISHALGPSQLSNKAAIPNFADVWRYGKHTWAGSLFRNTIGSDQFEKGFMRFWKQALLFRPGFALRFAGEEVANFLLRHGPDAWLKSRIASSLTDALNSDKEMRLEAAKLKAAAEGEDPNAVNQVDAGRLWHALTSHMPDGIAETARTPQDLAARIFGWHTVGWVQRQKWDIARRIVGDDILRVYQDLAKRGVIGEERFADHVDVALGHAHGYFGDIPTKGVGDWQALVKDANGIPMSLKSDTTFKVFQREDQEALPHYTMALSGVATDPVLRRAARGWQDGLGTDQQIQNVKDWILATYDRQQLADLEKAVEGGTAAPDAAEMIDKIKTKLKAHDELVGRHSVWYQTQDGRTRAMGATDDMIATDWARNVVEHVNGLTMTPESYTRAPEDAEEGWIAPDSGVPKPIRMADTFGPGTPHEIATRDEGRQISITDDQHPYGKIPAGHVRLFRPAIGDVAEQPLDVPNPGRWWTADYQRAATNAGEHGDVIQIDVPLDALRQHYDLHGAPDRENYINSVYAAQRPTTAGQVIHIPGTAYFESGRIGAGGTRQQRTLIGMLAQGVTPSAQDLAKIDRMYWPDQFVAPDVMLNLDSKGGALQRFMNWGFYHTVGRPANWISRQPIFGYNYYLARKEMETLASRIGDRLTPNADALKSEMEKVGVSWDSVGGPTDEEILGGRRLNRGSHWSAKKFDAIMADKRYVEDLAHDVAMDRAMSETMPYIHDPRARSQFQVMVRGLMPFWFAQEQFYKRWGRLFATYPEAFYKLQQTMNGLRNVGFVYKDQYGQDAFVYPGSQAVTDLLQKVFGASLPVSGGFQGEIAQLNPSMATGFAPWPSFSPVATIPLTVAGHMFPQVSKFAQFFQGPDAPPINSRDWATSLMDDIFPSIVNRMEQWAGTMAFGSPNSTAGPALYLTAMIQAAQQLEATGHGLPTSQSGDAATVQRYLDQISNWAKNMMLFRALFGFLAPATPNFKIGNSELGTELQALMATMPYDQAVTAFIKAHPHATADTIFETTTGNQGMSGAYVPAAQQAADFINANVGVFTKYAAAAPWLIDAPSASALFSQPAYDLEKQLNLRVHQSLSSWYTQLKYMEGANAYYPLETMVHAAEGQSAALQQLGITQDQAFQALGLPQGADIAKAWDAWRQGFLKAHPVFASEYQSKGGESAARRLNVVNEMQQMIATGSMPTNDTSKAIAGLMVPWEQFYTGMQASLASSPNDATQRDAAKAAFLAWGNAYVTANKAAAPYWNGVLMKVVEAF